jgi:hypothetical protein
VRRQIWELGRRLEKWGEREFAHHKNLLRRSLCYLRIPRLDATMAAVSHGAHRLVAGSVSVSLAGAKDRRARAGLNRSPRRQPAQRGREERSRQQNGEDNTHQI